MASTTNPHLFRRSRSRAANLFKLLGLMSFVFSSSAFVPMTQVRIRSSPQGGSWFVNTNRNREATKSSLFMAVGKSGAPSIQTPEEFTEKVLAATERPILVFFTAPWCGPCRLTNPAVKEAIKEFSGQIDAVEVCTDDLPDVASDAGVESIPTIQLYYEGAAVDNIVGCVATNVLVSAVKKVLEDVGLIA